MFNEMFWISTSFILFVVLARPLWRYIGATLDNHAIDVTQNLREAERMRTEAQALLGALRKELEEVRTRATAIVEHAQSEVSHILAEAASEAKNIAEKRSNLAIQRIAQYEDSILNKVKEEVMMSALTSVEQKLGQGLEKSLQLKMMEDSLDIIKKVVH